MFRLSVEEDRATLKRGIPQGFILGPLFSRIYTISDKKIIDYIDPTFFFLNVTCVFMTIKNSQTQIFKTSCMGLEEIISYLLIRFKNMIY